MIAMKRSLRPMVFVAGTGLWWLAFAFFGEVARTVGFVSSLLVLPIVYRRRRREIRAGRREPVFFGRGKHYPPVNRYVPFDEAMTELGRKLERQPNERRTN
jgi:hypothetical protein